MLLHDLLANYVLYYRVGFLGGNAPGCWGLGLM